MKLVINNSWGPFEVPAQFKYLENQSKDPKLLDIRKDPDLIKWVEEHPEGFDVNYGRMVLKVVDIPDESTDYVILDYDGVESVYFVVDGKLYGAN